MVKPIDWRRIRALPGPGQAAGAIMTAVVCLTLFHYWARADQLGHRAAGGGWAVLSGAPLPAALHLLAAGLLLGLVPLVGARLEGVSWRQLGLGPGRLGLGAFWIGVGVPIAILAGRTAAGDPAMAAVYPLNRSLTTALPSFLPHAGLLLVYYTAWELLFRGVLLLGLRDRLGDRAANVLQTALAVMAHFGRPPVETLSALPGSLAFGAITLRTGSIWPVVLIHWVVGLSLDWFLAG